MTTTAFLTLLFTLAVAARILGTWRLSARLREAGDAARTEDGSATAGQPDEPGDAVVPVSPEVAEHGRRLSVA
ncbi:hypothetical protein [Yinghuangia soli]|uniref:Uncharacterized protein n=1 Tax=Yinghuangia soli TaxID=2908204 RepID=A0AA41Q810_9ACTN|nr:hypothetical protein [Yinghuangia soli]MCF2533314.1 hypothetical protein [Yinghuangia soli]